MTTVFSNNQKFNITKSLYESIIKNNPELLQEAISLSDKNLDLLKYIFNEKFPGIEWTPDVENKVLSMYVKSGQKDNVFKKLLDDNRTIFVPEEKNNETNKTLSPKEKEENKNDDNELESFSNEERNKPKYSDIKKILLNFKEIKSILEQYMFNTNVPESVANFYDSCRTRIKNNVGMDAIQIKFNDWGSKTLTYLMRDIREIFIDTIKSNRKFGKINGVDIWEIMKTIDLNEFWKNVAVIDCYSSESYKASIAQINQVSSLRGSDINIYSRYIPKSYNAQTTAFIIIKTPETSNPYGLRSLDKEKDNEESKKISNNLEKTFENKYPPKIYIILVTEGLFKKWDAIKNIGNAFSNMMKGNYMGGKRYL